MEKLKKLIVNKSNYDLSNKDFSQIFERIESLQKQLEENNLFENFSSKTKELILKNVDELINQIKNFDSTKNEKYIQISNYYLSEIYAAQLSEYTDFKKILLGRIQKIEKELNSSFSAYEVKIKKVNNLIEEINKQKIKSKESVQKIEKSHKETTDFVNKYLTQITNESDKRIDAKRAAVDKNLELYQNKIEERIDGIVNNFKDNVDSWDKKFEELEGKKDDFEETLKIATTYYRESRFDEYSAEQKKQANFYRRLSLQLMIAVVLIILGITIWNLTEGAEWGYYITRSLIAFTLMIPAIYTSRESARHRRNADKYTHMANELRAFEITLKLDDLDKDIKNRIKEEIYKRYFGNILFEQKDIGDSINEFFKNFKASGKKN